MSLMEDIGVVLHDVKPLPQIVKIVKSSYSETIEWQMPLLELEHENSNHKEICTELLKCKSHYDKHSKKIILDKTKTARNILETIASRSCNEMLDFLEMMDKKRNNKVYKYLSRNRWGMHNNDAKLADAIYQIWKYYKNDSTTNKTVLKKNVLGLLYNVTSKHIDR